MPTYEYYLRSIPSAWREDCRFFVPVPYVEVRYRTYRTVRKERYTPTKEGAVDRGPTKPKNENAGKKKTEHGHLPYRSLRYVLYGMYGGPSGVEFNLCVFLGCYEPYIPLP